MYINAPLNKRLTIITLKKFPHNTDYLEYSIKSQQKERKAHKVKRVDFIQSVIEINNKATNIHSIKINKVSDIDSMLPLQQDSYNRLISKQQLQSSYKIFKELLKPECKNKNLRKQILAEKLQDNALHRVILLDCHRTRSTNFNESIKNDLKYFLGYFVRSHQIQYKQGLNEIAAPFIYWTLIGVDIGECYEMFQQFFIRFSLNFYYDKNFTGLQMFFRMISIVLRYHCPSLSRYLQVYDIQPQLYALSWLMTLFSSKLSLQMTYLLWSYLIAENDRYLLFFIVVGIIVRRQSIIIQTQNSSIFKIVTDMIFKGEEELEEVVKISLILRNNTPMSLTAFFDEKQLFDRMDSYKDSAQLLEHINRLNLFLILPKQLYYSKSHHPSICQKQSCTLCRHHKPITFDRQLFHSSYLKNLIDISNDIKKIKNNIDYVILDLRKERTKLNSSFTIHSVDINQPFQIIQSEFLNLFIESKYSVHFLILLTGFTFEDVTFSDPEEFKCANKLLKVLNSYSFSYLGILQGGYTALSIFQQEFRIKQQLEKLTQKNDQKSQTISRNSNQIDRQSNNFPFVVDKQLNLSLSLLFQIADLKFTGQLKFFHGQKRTVSLVTECYVVVVQDIKGFGLFMSFLEHNCSIMPYFLSNFANIQCKVLKVLPICMITELKTKQKYLNVLVIKYQQGKQVVRPTIKIQSRQNSSASETSYSVQQSIKELLSKKYTYDESSMNKSQDSKSVTFKNINIGMQSSLMVKNASSAIEKSFKNQLRKKYQNAITK